jgi:O-acetyl-ADP-ribose deacetylase (regulator of RNase III)
MDVMITVKIGDITKQPDCEGIVNSANANLRAGSGVCGAIHSAAGPALEVYSQRLAPLEIGCSVPTPGFNLPNWFVIHTRAPKYHFDSDPPTQLARAIETALIVADSIKIVRLAIPAISMGVYAYPPEEAVPILVRSANFISPRLGHVKEIRFIVVSEKLFQLFQKEIYEPSFTSQQMIGESKYDVPPFLRRDSD